MIENNNKITSLKIGLMGYLCSGKTAILQTFFGEGFNEDLIATTGFEKVEKSYKLENGRKIKLIGLDTTGAPRFRSQSLKFLKEVHGIALIFDVTSKHSFDDINDWLEEIKENFSSSSLVLLGNKIDKEKDKWQVTQEEIDSFVKNENIKYFAVSAKTNKGINESFNYLINKIITNIQLKEKYPEENNDEKLKELLLNELNHYKNEYDKLKEDYDALNKNYEKLKNNNDKLDKDLNKTKYTIYNLEDKVKKNLNEINNLKNIICQKEDEIINLNFKIKNFESFNKTSFNKDDIISVHFISSDQNINCPIKCLKTDTFAEVEEKLYQKYQEYRETNNNFALKEKIIMRFKTIIENSIIDGDKIELIKSE